MQAEFLTNNLMLTWLFTFMTGIMVFFFATVVVYIISGMDWWKNGEWLNKITPEKVFVWGFIFSFSYAVLVAVSSGTMKVVIDDDVQTPPRVESVGEVKDTSEQNKTFEERENEIVDSFTEGNFDE